MLKVERTQTFGWMEAIRGMRNPLNSWTKMDSTFTLHERLNGGIVFEHHIQLGPNDLDLMRRLRNAGTADHRKFLRMITVYMDILAPLYWWKQFDQYKVGVTTNSCSTMHKIHSKEFTIDDFSTDHFIHNMFGGHAKEAMYVTVKALNYYRDLYLNGGDMFDNGLLTVEPKNKEAWYQMIQLLPSSYNQKRTVMMNYEVLLNIYKSRKSHKLDEWHTLCDVIAELPYAKELILGE